MNEIALEWSRVRAYAEQELERLRQRNDSVELGKKETAATRGEIRALKKLLDLPARVAQAAQTEPQGFPSGFEA